MMEQKPGAEQRQSLWRRTRQGVSRWWNGGPLQKAALILAVPMLAVCACCSAGLIFAATPAGRQLSASIDATSTAQARVDARATATAVQYALLHPAPTSAPTQSKPTATSKSTATAMPTGTPTPRATATSAPSGPPFVGGPYSNFVSAYGPPFQQGYGNSEDFYADAAQTIILNVSPPSGTVNHLAVVGPTTWSNQQTFDYCTQFLPSDAVAFNSVGPYTDYNSSVGEVIIDNTGGGTCLVYTPS